MKEEMRFDQLKPRDYIIILLCVLALGTALIMQDIQINKTKIALREEVIKACPELLQNNYEKQGTPTVNVSAQYWLEEKNS